MSKVVLDDVISGYGLSKINENFQKIEDELNNKVLYRDNPVDEINTIEQDLDLNGFSLYNVEKINNVAVDTFTANVETVAGSIDSVNTVATNIANVNIVAGIDDDVTDVAAVADAVAILAPYAPDVSAYATGIYNNLASEDAGKGAELIEYQGGTVEDALDVRLPEFANYAALDAYNGPVLPGVYIQGRSNIFDGGHGIFRPTTETPSGANGIYRQDALSRWWKRDYSGWVNVLWFGVSASEIQAASDFLTDLAKTNVNGVYMSVGGDLYIPPLEYLLDSGVSFFCNVHAAGASFIFPSNFSGIGVTLGIGDANHVLVDVAAELPEVIRPQGSNIRDGSVGVRFVNLWGGQIKKGRVRYWDCGEHYDSVEKGHVYVNYTGGQILGCRVPYKLKPTGSVNNSFVNENNIIGGGSSQPITMGLRQSDIYSVVLDGDGKATVNNNRFWGVSFEGDAGLYKVYGRHARENHFYSCRWEQGLALDYNWFAVTVDASADTFGKVGHGLANGTAIVVAPATTTPGGLIAGYVYYVANATDDTFQLKLSPSDSSVVDITSIGSDVRYSFPVQHYFDGSTYETTCNIIHGGEYTYRDAINVVNSGALATMNYVSLSQFRHVFDGKNLTNSGVVAIANRQGASGVAAALFGSDPTANTTNPLATIHCNGQMRYYASGVQMANWGYGGVGGRMQQATSQNLDAIIDNVNTNAGTATSASIRATSGPDGSNVGRIQLTYVPSGNTSYPASVRKRSVVYALGSGSEVPDGIALYAPASGSNVKVFLGGSNDNYSFGLDGLFVRNVSAPPSTPTNGGVLYVESGALKYKGSSGTITVIGPA